MAANTSPIFVLASNLSAATFVNADGTNLKTLFTAGAEGSLLTAIAITSDDTAARDLNLYVTISGTDYRVGQVNIPIGAGTTTTSAVNALAVGKLPWLNADGSFFLPAGQVLKGAMAVAVTAAKTVTVLAVGGDY